MADREERLEKMRRRWEKVRGSRAYHNVLIYLVFVIIAALFWLMLALNDNTQDSVDVSLKIYNVPDSVTFINDPPAQIHITLRDKGTSLLQTVVFHKPTIHLNFKEFSQQGIFRLPPSELYSMLRSTFGSSAQISSVSIDSLRLEYTTNPGLRVPLAIRANLSTADGFVIAGNLKCSVNSVLVYSNSAEADTITRVYTQMLSKRGLNSSGNYQVAVQKIPGVKIVPSVVNVFVPVEALVKKKSTIPIKVRNEPAGESLLIFPANVDVTYFVPMSKFNDKNPDIDVYADYSDLQQYRGGHLPIHVGRLGKGLVNATLLTDSVEYTIVRQ